METTMGLKPGALLVLLPAVSLTQPGLSQPGASQPPPSAPAAASPEGLRTLAVPADAPWRHAATGMTLPARVGGFARRHVRDSTEAEFDVVATYVDRDEGIIALVYLYRTMTPDVPVWFDRALAQVVLPTGQPWPAIAGFTRPGATAASGLRTALNDNVPGIRSTAIAIAPLGPWLVKVRLGSRTLEPAALAERLDAFVAALTWPAQTGTARAAVPVQPCPTPLRLQQARVVNTRTEDMLLDSALATAAPARGDVGPPPVYCREPGATVERGVYRPGAATDAYLIAMDDAGIALGVGDATGLSALIGNSNRRPHFPMILLERNSSSTLPSFDRLPPPDQALAVARSSTPTMTTTVGD
jgi:hypothetical protein